MDDHNTQTEQYLVLGCLGCNSIKIAPHAEQFENAQAAADNAVEFFRDEGGEILTVTATLAISPPEVDGKHIILVIVLPEQVNKVLTELEEEKHRRDMELADLPPQDMIRMFLDRMNRQN